MTARRYVIVGGGMAADAGAQALREADPSGEITVISADIDPPYSRPPLSKGLWKGDAYESIWRGTEKTGAKILLNRKAVSIDRAKRSVLDDRGDAHSYDALLLATGGTPSRLKSASDSVLYFRSANDYRRLRELCERGQRFAVIGGGFIGSEIAAALRMNGKDVVLLFPERGVGARVFPKAMSEHLVGYYREKGVDVQAEAMVSAVVTEGSLSTVTTAAGGRFEVDGVVAGIGIRPNVELAQAAGLTVDDGIVVNDRLQTSDPSIFAAGDVARFPATGLQRLVRLEHEDAALSMGRAAGQIMAGSPARFTHLPFFYSDLFELGYEAVGVVDSRLDTTAQWKEPFKEGVVFYTEGGQVRGVLLVNTWGQVDKARKIIMEGMTIDRAADALAV